MCSTNRRIRIFFLCFLVCFAVIIIFVYKQRFRVLDISDWVPESRERNDGLETPKSLVVNFHACVLYKDLSVSSGPRKRGGRALFENKKSSRR